MILLGLVAVALAIVYAAHRVCDELRTLNAFVRRLMYLADAEHTARIERDAITANATAAATTTATASSAPPRKRRRTRAPEETPTTPTAPSAPSLHIPTQPFGTPLSPRSD